MQSHTMPADPLITTDQSVKAAIAYLLALGKLDTLGKEVPIVGRNLCLWMPARFSSLVNNPLRHHKD